MVRMCPRCARPLVDVRRGALDVWACKACGGVWLEGATLEGFADALRKRTHLVADVAHATRDALFDFSLDPDTVLCPCCRETMDAVHAEGPTVDVCAAHGVWFDRDELEQVVNGEGGAAVVDAALAQRKTSTSTSSVSHGLVGDAMVGTLDVANAVASSGADANDVVELAASSIDLLGGAMELLGGTRVRGCGARARRL